MNDHVYVTSNALDSIPDFVSVQGNLPKIPVYSCVVEMNDKNRVIIGSEEGIYSTDNIESGSWTADNDGIGKVPVFMLKQQTKFYPYTYINDNGKIFTYPGVQNYGAIYAASYGKGIFIDTSYYDPMGIDPGNGKGVSLTALRVYPNPFKDKTTIGYSLNVKSDVTLTIYDASGREVKTVNQSKMVAGNHDLIIDLHGQPSGTYMIRMMSKDGNGFGKLMKTN